MAAFEVIALDTATPQLRAPGSSDQYTFPRAITGTSNILEQRNSTSAQAFRVFNTWTDASNGEWGAMRWNSNVLEIGAYANGTGTVRDIKLIASSQIWTAARYEIGGSFGNPNVLLSQFGLFMQSGGAVTMSSGSAYAAADIGISRTSAGILEVNNGTTGQFRDVKTRNVITVSTTVASLVAAATAGAGARCFVSDANATTYASVVAGGGANKVPVYSDGTNWLIG